MFHTWRIAILALLLVAPSFAAKESGQTEAELKAVQAEIERVRLQVRRDQVERDRLSRELRDAELSAGDVRDSLEEIRARRAEHAQRRVMLANEKAEHQRALARERSALAGQLRTAYLIGREEPLKLLLNQKDPTRAGRMFAYYSYFGRARADQITRITEHVQRVEELETELESTRPRACDPRGASAQRARTTRSGARKTRRSTRESAERVALPTAEP